MKMFQKNVKIKIGGYEFVYIFIRKNFSKKYIPKHYFFLYEYDIFWTPLYADQLEAIVSTSNKVIEHALNFGGTHFYCASNTLSSVTHLTRSMYVIYLVQNIF